MRKKDRPSILLASFLAFAMVPLISLSILGMRVSSIQIEGITDPTRVLLMKHLERLKGLKLFSINSEMIEHQFGHRWVVCESVRKVMPGKVIIKLKPRIALVDTGGTWLDREGKTVMPQLSPPPPLSLQGTVTYQTREQLVTLASSYPDFLAQFPVIRVLSSRHWILNDDHGSKVHFDPFQPDICMTRWEEVVPVLRDLPQVTDIDLRFAGRAYLRSSGGEDEHAAVGH
ncbi:MAG TPA: hypothetical protein PK014_06235 [Thermoanaerobaculia bacterium]|nr:hypothetical protein [Thermoanaerobaculia bacterium]HUM29350.1 hypothetical protein [Thermoanaerobaculia bacterium]HXK67596.1 hypothetical protein [Thermoanaerobaculia bacterium]